MGESQSTTANTEVVGIKPKTVFVLRAVPGSGKSYRTRKIMDSASKQGLRVEVVSADNYFMQNGKYNFDAKKLYLAHSVCQATFEACLQKDIDIVIVDNTNILPKEFRFYVEKAEEYNYNVELVEIRPKDKEELKFFMSRNQHGVPTDDASIERWYQKALAGGLIGDAK